MWLATYNVFCVKITHVLIIGNTITDLSPSFHLFQVNFAVGEQSETFVSTLQKAVIKLLGSVF